MIFNMQPLDPVIVSLGPIDLRWYGVIIAFGMLLGFLIASREADKKKMPEGMFIDLMFYIILFSLIGARLYYVFFNLDYYLQDPISIIMVNEGGMAIHGGIIGGILAGLIYCYRKNLSFFQVADIAIPSLILGQAIGRWGNFMNQEAHGGEVTRNFLESLMLPEFIIDQMYIDGAYYHPTFLYESVWNIIGFIILILLRPKLKIGQTMLLYLIYYSVGRFFIEGMRTDSLMIGDVLRTAQVISIITVVIAIAVWIYRNRAYDLPKYGDVDGVYDPDNKRNKKQSKTKGRPVNKKHKRKK
ncbi:prolipoprotein diacylglyceryl transferase [Salinicoccus sp. Marseille-QA3877]